MNTLFSSKILKSKLFIFTAVLIFTTTITNCDSSDNGTNELFKKPTVSSEKHQNHNFRLFLKKSSTDDIKIASILINIKSIEINSAEDDWFTIIDYGESGRIVDIILFKDGLSATMGYLNLKPGVYNQIRIKLNNENLILDKNYSLVPLRIPSGSQTGIKIVRPFEITKNGITSVTLDFDVKKSIHYNKGQGYMLKPTIKLKSVDTADEVTQTIRSEEGGNISILNELDMQIPPNSLSEDTDITFKKIDTTYKMPFSSTYILSNYYAFSPENLIFNQNISISINYSDSKILEHNINEENLKIYSIESDNGQWQKLQSTVDSEQMRVSAVTNKLSTFSIGGPPATAPWIDPAQVIEASNGTHTSQVPLKVKAQIVDSDGVEKATLSYKEIGTLAFYTLEMTNVGNNLYEAEIPMAYLKDQIDPTGIEVFIEAIDNSGDVSFAPVTSSAIPHLYEYDPDLDNDNINDRWELDNGLDITFDDSQLDPDNDGFTNYEEYVNNTDPQIPEFEPGPEDIESLCVVNKESHFWNNENWDFAVIDTSNNVIPLTSANFLDADFSIDISRFYIVETYYIRYSYKTKNTSGTVGPVSYFAPSTDVRLYNDFFEIDSFYEEHQRSDYLETWTPLPIYIKFDINYIMNAWSNRGGTYSESFHMIYQDM